MASAARRLDDIERDKRHEARLAEAWLERHEAELAHVPDKGRGYNHETYDPLVDLFDSEENKSLFLRSLFRPLVGQRQKLSANELERRARLEHVLTFLLPDHIRLIEMRHIENMTLEAIAAEMVCSHVNVIKRLRVAEQDFRREYANHYEDPGVVA